MRDILFRGKCTTSKEWAKGGIMHGLNGEMFIVLPLSEKDNEVVIPVVPETVGQFTGLNEGCWTIYAKKTKGKDELEKIFEGDIIMCDLDIDPDGRTGIIGKVFFKDGSFRFGSELHNRELSECYNRIKIGNIHDNLELLGEVNAP